LQAPVDQQQGTFRLPILCYRSRSMGDHHFLCIPLYMGWACIHIRFPLQTRCQTKQSWINWRDFR